ncbi:MAG: 23S rRNA (adenine(2503)-C(2))-methyltransferase RlmN [Treponema sp.]|jgi:23S rRNA (adenine2503-C2)-methyltransferase|nr:23S rRNA (adenine(2503)-C(2))-methyltransferase RlmN [Treponema sp.]
MRVLSGCSLEELVQILAPLSPYKAGEVFKWISRGARGFEGMTSLGKREREDLSRRFTIRSTGRGGPLADRDGTVKLRITLRGAAAEAVLLRDKNGRGTACISSQAGCSVGCVFCKTGSLGFLRNLDAAEMVEQFLHIREIGAEQGTEVTHLVVMGMGEPLLNLGELRRAAGIIMDPRGLGVSWRRITVSTSGIIAGIRKLADSGPPLRLAFSLTSAREELRNALIPSARDNPLKRIKDALVYYRQKTGRRITLEAVLLGGINTGAEEASAIRDFARGLDAVVNLIPWNPVEGLMFQGRALREPSPAETEAFIRLLRREGLKVTRRFRRGRGVSGACGQLGWKTGDPDSAF